MSARLVGRRSRLVSAASQMMNEPDLDRLTEIHACPQRPARGTAWLENHYQCGQPRFVFRPPNRDSVLQPAERAVELGLRFGFEKEVLDPVRTSRVLVEYNFDRVVFWRHGL